MKYLTDREIHVAGIQRTGQHAITSWLIGHFDSVCYKNCMSPQGAKKGKMGFQPPYWYFEPKKRDDWLESDDPQIRDRQDAIIMGTEFTVFDVALNPDIPKHLKRSLSLSDATEFSKRRDNILVIRNPYNQYASILNWGMKKLLSPVPSFTNMWIKTAKKCLEAPSWTVAKTEDGWFPYEDSWTVVKYDDWFVSKDYRIEIEKKLDLERDDSRKNTVMKIGYRRSWGSSFDGMKKKSQAQNMDVLNRWEKAKDDPRFIELCKNEEMRDLSKQLGWNCPL